VGTKPQRTRSPGGGDPSVRRSHSFHRPSRDAIYATSQHVQRGVRTPTGALIHFGHPHPWLTPWAFYTSRLFGPRHAYRPRVALKGRLHVSPGHRPGFRVANPEALKGRNKQLCRPFRAPGRFPSSPPGRCPGLPCGCPHGASDDRARSTVRTRIAQIQTGTNHERIRVINRTRGDGRWQTTRLDQIWSTPQLRNTHALWGLGSASFVSPQLIARIAWGKSTWQSS